MIKMRISDVVYLQTAKGFEVYDGERLILSTSNGVEAEIHFCGIIERRIHERIRPQLEAQDINPLTGEKTKENENGYC